MSNLRGVQHNKVELSFVLLSKNVKILKVTSKRIDKKNKTAELAGGMEFNMHENLDLVLLLGV